MIDRLIAMTFIISVLMVLYFIIMATLNVRENIEKNRRRNREYRDQKQFERFQNRETK